MRKACASRAARLPDAPPSTWLRAGFDTLLCCASPLPFDKLRTRLRMLDLDRVAPE